MNGHYLYLTICGLWLIVISGCQVSTANENQNRPTDRRVSDYGNDDGRIPDGRDNGIDDTQAIQRALNAGPGIVALGPGVYCCNTITVPTQVTLIGSGLAQRYVPKTASLSSSSIRLMSGQFATSFSMVELKVTGEPVKMMVNQRSSLTIVVNLISMESPFETLTVPAFNSNRPFSNFTTVFPTAGLTSTALLQHKITPVCVSIFAPNTSTPPI